MLRRILDLKIPRGQSLFLWGARKTGKSTFLNQVYPNNLRVDLLQGDALLRYSKTPHILREEILNYSRQGDYPVIIDEIQKVPALLDEIHWLIENGPQGCSFVLCGSSLRRLKHEEANLLGGRAWRQMFMPLCYPEMPTFDMRRIVNHGLLPTHYLYETIPTRLLEGYVTDYLIPEVQWESRIRQLGAFSRFLEAIAYSNGETVNVSNISREAGVSVKTVQAYMDLLVDMLLGYVIYPYSSKSGRQTITSMPKFYFFDTGIVRFLRTPSVIEELKGPDMGHAFEHYIFLELQAYKNIHHKNGEIQYWRTKTGLEVDFVVGRGTVAIETKLASPEKKDLRGLIAFTVDHQPQKAMVVSLESKRRTMQIDEGVSIEIYPVEDFLTALWQGDIF